jgi:hypothetical protein
MHTLTVGRTQCRRHARLSSATAINATAVYITAVIVTPELSSTRPTAAADDADDATAVAAHGCVAIVTSCVSPSLVYLGPTLRNWCPCLQGLTQLVDVTFERPQCTLDRIII